MITCNRKALMSALEQCQRVIAGAMDPPDILKNVALSADGMALDYRATNLTVTIGGALPAAGKGGFLVNPRDALAMLTGLDGDEVKIKIVDGKAHLQGAGKRLAKVKVRPLDNFPEALARPPEDVMLPGSAIVRGLEAVLFAAGDAQSSEACKVMRVKASGGVLETAATNGRQAAIFSTPVETELSALTLAVTSCKLLAELLDPEESVRVGQSESAVCFSWASQWLICAKPTSDLPVMDYVFSLTPPGEFKTDRQTLAASLHAVMRADAKKDVLLHLDPSGLVIECQGENYARDELGIECSKSSKVALAAEAFMAALRAAGDEISFRYGDTDTDPFMMTSEGWRAILMPLRLEQLKERTGLG